MTMASIESSYTREKVRMRLNVLVPAMLSLIVLISYQCVYYPIDAESVMDSEDKTDPTGRSEYEHRRLIDPETGKIPSNMRMRELAFVSSLQNQSAARSTKVVQMDVESVGPYNVGGRTRAFAIDILDTNTYMAGAVSGGMWKSTDRGATWKRTTAPEDHAAVSCVSQDVRPGRENVWYYGSGEVNGNSASKSYSAFYRGSGIYKSEDNGETWTLLPSTAALIQKASDWDAVFRVKVDPTRFDSNIVYAAMSEGIMRSNDGGDTWKESLSANAASYTDFEISDNGVLYAVISSDGGGNRGMWRSTDGVNWTDITPEGFPNNHRRTLVKMYEADQDIVYFFSNTPGSGTTDNSLWRYEYFSGDGTGTGGLWENRSSGLPIERLNVFNGYCQVLAIKPDNEDVIFVGGTNLFRSTNGFIDTNANMRIGGYDVDWYEEFSYRTGEHYPDQQNIVFNRENPDMMISTTDGGIHRTYKCAESGFRWQSLSNGFISSQFYGIAIDEATAGSEQIMGGLQDRGTFWTNTASPSHLWTSIRGADGAYCWITDGGQYQYSSTQYANVRRTQVNANGEYGDWVRLIPESMDGGYLFVHPFTLDPVDNNIMYLPRNSTLWRNHDLNAAENEVYEWSNLVNITGTITAISASRAEQGVVYLGNSQGLIYRVENAHEVGGNITSELISSNGIQFGRYTSCIAIDPKDADRAIVVYSNYNVRSLWLTEDGGDSWEPIEGNLIGTKDENVPPELAHISDGPSMRWVEIAHTEDGYVYFLGTSVGLFSTRELKGDSTIWVQEGVNTIGNVVVDMLKYRESDQWLVVGTHGNGIYAGTVVLEDTSSVIDTATGVADRVNLYSRISVFPNPTADEITVSMDYNGLNTISLLDAMGRTIYVRKAVKSETKLDLREFAQGTFYVKVENADGQAIKKVLKR